MQHLLGTGEVCRALATKEITIQKWIQKGHFAPTLRGAPGRHKFSTSDLAALACGLQLRKSNVPMSTVANAMRLIQRSETLERDLAAGRDSLLICNGTVYGSLVSRAELLATVSLGQPDLIGSKAVVLCDVGRAIEGAMLSVRAAVNTRPEPTTDQPATVTDSQTVTARQVTNSQTP